MKICNFGSMNVDYVYQVDSFLQPGETKASQDFCLHCGGKGLNQSIAAAKAGNHVIHAGILGKGGEDLEAVLRENGVDTEYLQHMDAPNGHAIIQVDRTGQNCILLYGGTNQMLTETYVCNVLDAMGKDTFVLLQNETNLVGYIMQQAHARGMRTAWNAAPINERIHEYPLELLDWLIVNEIEGRQIAACEREEDILPVLRKKYPQCGILLTLGSRGALCSVDTKTYQIGCFDVPVIDTTAAGDTFTGYFLYGILYGKSIPECLLLATTASSIAIGKQGAADSIPLLKEVESMMKEHAFGVLQVKEWSER